MRKLLCVVALATTFFACKDGKNGQDGVNGVDGLTALVINDVEPTGANCATGGNKVTAGHDADKNGALDAAEVTRVSYVCNGADGVAGERSLVLTTNEPEGSNCVKGGVKFQSGLDTSADGTLQTGEVTQSSFLCNGELGPAGKNTLVKMEVETAGSNCPAGGQKVSSGLDADGDTTLSTTEVQASSFVCHGVDGLRSLTALATEPNGSNCTVGGTKVTSGLDSNKNSALDAAEVTSTTFVCNGADGANGQNGLRALVKLDPEPVGINCTPGGVRVQSGIDTNANNGLDASEVLSTSYVCNGANGTNGINALVRQSNEPAGANCVAGGTRVDSGSDTSNNGSLDAAEITSTRYLCNGLNGTNGRDSLIVQALEAPGPNCVRGGTKVQTGVDTNGDSALGAAEISATAYVCHGAVSLVKITVEPNGANCLTGGRKIESGVDGNGDGALAAAEVSATEFVCNGANGANGTNGLRSLIAQTPISAGALCAAGGTKIDSGLDTNANNILEASEVSSSSNVCNGASGTNGTNGLKSLIAMSVEVAGSNCTTGGTRVDSGLDGNNNNALDAAEISLTRYVCNGLNGAAGANGFSVVAAQSPEPSGANCTNGGVAIKTGLDLDRDLILDNGEIQNTSYACNGASGAAGKNSLVKQTPEAVGANCPAGGTKLESGVDSDGNNALDAGEVSATTYVCNAAVGPLVGVEFAFGISDVEGNTLTFTAQLVDSGGLPTTSTKTVRVAYFTTDGTAKAGQDYTPVSGILTFAPGDAQKSLTVSLVDDALDEDTESFQVVLGSPENAWLQSVSALAGIQDGDTTPSVSVSAFGAVNEGGVGSTTRAFALVSLSSASGRTVSASWQTADGTATAGSDYSADAASLTFAPGETSKLITLTVTGDNDVEEDESFSVSLVSATNATVASASDLIRISNDDGVPALSIANATGDEASGVAFTVTMTPASTLPVTVSYSTLPGTASASDFVMTSGTLTFSPGETTKTISVTGVDDSIRENSEVLYLLLSSPTNATLSTAQATGTLAADSDNQPSLSVAPVAVSEGGTGQTTQVSVWVSLSSPSGQTVTVNAATTNYTAASGVDYVGIGSTTLTFLPGETTKALRVNVLGDAVVEPNEAFNVLLSGASNASISSGTAQVTILDDDQLPALTISDVVVNEGGSANFIVRLSSPANSSVTFNYATQDGTAAAGFDYSPTNTVATIPAGSMSTVLTVDTNDETLFEGDETFSLVLSSVTGAMLYDAVGDATITDDDPAPQISVATILNATEGSTVLFNVTLSVQSALPVTVLAIPEAISANDGLDFAGAAKVLTFNPGSTSQVVSVTTFDDTIDEDAETFGLRLANATGGFILTGTATATISDNDSTPVLFIGDTAVRETATGGIASIVLSLDRPSSKTVSVQLATADGTASSASDYTGFAAPMTFPPGETVLVVPVAIRGDSVAEPDEYFTLTLGNESFCTLGRTGATVAILDDDTLPTISINDVRITESNGGTSQALFTLTLSRPASSAVTVNWATANGTATSGSDYSASSGTATFAAGNTTTFIQVPVNGDSMYGYDETFIVALSSPTNAAVIAGADRGTGTIVNDDPMPSISFVSQVFPETNTLFTAPLMAQLSSLAEVDVTFTAATRDNTALEGSDYTAFTRQLTFNAGTLTLNTNLTIFGDVTFEGNEQLFIDIFATTNGIAGAPTAITIANDD